MNQPQAILAGAALIAASVIVVGLTAPAVAQQHGPFALMQHSNTVAPAGVFRVDTSSGDVSYCYVNSNSALNCIGPVR